MTNVIKTLLYVIDETSSNSGKNTDGFVDLTERILDIEAIENQKVVNNYKGLIFQQPMNITPNIKTKYFLLVERTIAEADIKIYEKNPFIECEEHTFNDKDEEVIEIKTVTENIFDLENLLFDEIIELINKHKFKQSLLIY